MLESPIGSVAVLLTALAIDRWCGEPRAALHPVVWIGSTTTRLLRFAPDRGPGRQLAFGALIAVVVPGLAAAVTLVASWTLGEGARHAAQLLAGHGFASTVATAAIGIAELGARAWILKTLFAMQALGDAAFVVRDALRSADLPRARSSLASLCSRDASALDEPALAAAAVESVAENASDSIVAPLLSFLLLGLPGAAFYRAANTLDAMIGYRGRFEHLGKAAARLDDLWNLVPARLTALLLLAGGVLARADLRSGARILARDASRTESPNAGWPMAAMAGLLDVALEKPGHYRLGDARVPLRPETIDAAWRIVTRAMAIGTATAAAACALAQLAG